MKLILKHTGMHIFMTFDSSKECIGLLPEEIFFKYVINRYLWYTLSSFSTYLLVLASIHPTNALATQHLEQSFQYTDQTRLLSDYNFSTITA